MRAIFHVRDVLPRHDTKSTKTGSEISPNTPPPPPPSQRAVSRHGEARKHEGVLVLVCSCDGYKVLLRSNPIRAFAHLARPASLFHGRRHPCPSSAVAAPRRTTANDPKNDSQNRSPCSSSSSPSPLRPACVRRAAGREDSLR